MLGKAALKRIAAPVIRRLPATARHRAMFEEALLQRLQCVLAADPVVCLPAFEGDFELDCRSDLFKRIFTQGEYEPELAHKCRELVDPNRDAIDIGANIGFFTVLFSKLTAKGKVLSIEPTPNALERLFRNIMRNQVDGNVIVFEGAASSTAGFTNINTVVGREEYSSLGAMVHGSITDAPISTVTVKTSTIDALVEEHGLAPGFIKVDTEGWEHEVFAGCAKVLKEHRPIVVSEVNAEMLAANGSSVDHVLNLFKNLDYVVVNPFTGKKELGNVNEILCCPR